MTIRGHYLPSGMLDDRDADKISRANLSNAVEIGHTASEEPIGEVFGLFGQGSRTRWPSENAPRVSGVAASDTRAAKRYDVPNDDEVYGRARASYGTGAYVVYPRHGVAASRPEPVSVERIRRQGLWGCPCALASRQDISAATRGSRPAGPLGLGPTRRR